MKTAAPSVFLFLRFYTVMSINCDDTPIKLKLDSTHSRSADVTTDRTVSLLSPLLEEEFSKAVSTLQH